MVYIVIEELDSYCAGSDENYFIHGAFDSKEKADECIAELIKEEKKEWGNEHKEFTEYRGDDVGLNFLGSFFFVKEMEVK